MVAQAMRLAVETVAWMATVWSPALAENRLEVAISRMGTHTLHQSLNSRCVRNRATAEAAAELALAQTGAS